MAHELAHIKNRDTLTMTVAASIGGAISMFANMLQFGMLFGGTRNGRGNMLGTLVAALVAPVAATLVQMAISRSREYQADQIGARICGNPLWLASALIKINDAVRGGVRMESAQRHSGDRADVHRQSADRARHRQPVLDPPQPREPRCRAREIGARDGHSGKRER